MGTATARAPQPGNAKGRTVSAARPLTNLVSNDTATDTTRALRLQRLRLLGIIGQRAQTIAGIAWGEVANG